ncbi:MAG: ribosome maturation factor RimM [Pseudomonadota bacterium]
MARRSRPAEPRAPSDDGAGEWVCMAVIGAPKGVRGALKITCFSEEPDSVVAYGPLSVGPGEGTLTLRLLERLKNNQIVAAVEGVEDRDTAAALTGTRLYLRRADLPEPEDDDEFYFHDLIGLAVQHVDGHALGRVTAVHDHGAGAFLEVLPDGANKTVIIPFTREAVPVVDLENAKLVADPPPGLVDDG